MTPDSVVVELEERVTHAECARDNALALLEQAHESKKTSSKRSGTIISALVDLIMMMSQDIVNNTVAEAHIAAMNKILGKE